MHVQYIEQLWKIINRFLIVIIKRNALLHALHIQYIQHSIFPRRILIFVKKEKLYYSSKLIRGAYAIPCQRLNLLHNNRSHIKSHMPITKQPTQMCCTLFLVLLLCVFFLYFPFLLLPAIEFNFYNRKNFGPANH